MVAQAAMLDRSILDHQTRIRRVLMDPEYVRRRNAAAAGSAAAAAAAAATTRKRRRGDRSIEDDRPVKHGRIHPRLRGPWPEVSNVVVTLALLKMRINCTAEVFALIGEYLGSPALPPPTR